MVTMKNGAADSGRIHFVIVLFIPRIRLCCSLTLFQRERRERPRRNGIEYGELVYQVGNLAQHGRASGQLRRDLQLLSNEQQSIRKAVNILCKPVEVIEELPPHNDVPIPMQIYLTYLARADEVVQ